MPLRERLKLSVPEDVMVAGFDDITSSRWHPYRLTTIRQPVEAMVDDALELLNLDDPEEALERGINRVHKVRLIWRSTITPPKYPK
ncbi:substrate-binding domain-containing protein [Falsigemmobacter intermedius]